MVVVTVGVSLGTPQGLELKVLLSRVTAPFMAKSLPLTEAPVIRVIEVIAMTVPAKALELSRVAELPTTQNTFPACAPLTSATELPAAVISVLVAWKMKTAPLSPAASRVRVPVSPHVPDPEP
jgi:hypothetical protein